MIGTIVIGSGNNRRTIERERNLGMSKDIAAAMKRYLGIPAHSGLHKGKSRKAA